MKKSGSNLSLVATIMSLFQVLGMLVLFGGIILLKNNSMFAHEIEQLLNESGLSFSELGITYDELLAFVLIAVGFVLALNVTKLIFGFLAYRKNSEALHLVAVLLSVFSLLIGFYFMELIFIAVYELLVACLFFVVFYRIRKEKVVYKPKNNDENKMVIDIET